MSPKKEKSFIRDRVKDFSCLSAAGFPEILIIEYFLELRRQVLTP